MSGFKLSDLMNAQSVPKKARTNEYLEIPIELLEPNPDNPYGIRDVDELAASIEALGLLHNLVVEPKNEQGKYVIISGERRYRAISLLREKNPDRWTTISCKVDNGESDTLNKLRLLHANATARELTDFEKAEQARQIKETLLDLKKEGYKFKGRMREIIADMLDVSPSQMGRLESINEHLCDGLKQAFSKGDIGVTEAYNASLLEDAKQAEVLEEVNRGNTDGVTTTLDSKKKRPVSVKKESKAEKLARDVRTLACSLMDEHHLSDGEYTVLLNAAEILNAKGEAQK